MGYEWPDEDDENEDPDGIITCWCGAQGTAKELFDAEVYTLGPCGGLGQLYCECGGDLCVCHNHGWVECPGCEDCEPEHEGWESDDEA